MAVLACGWDRRVSCIVCGSIFLRPNSTLARLACSSVARCGEFRSRDLAKLQTRCALGSQLHPGKLLSHFAVPGPVSRLSLSLRSAHVLYSCRPYQTHWSSFC